MSQSHTASDGEPAKTLCVGRYTVDLPQSATNVRLAQSFRGVDIDVIHPATNAALDEALKRKLAEEEKQVGAAPTLVSAHTGNKDDSVQIWRSGDNLYWVHGLLLKQDTGFLFSAGVTGESLQEAKTVIGELAQTIQLRDISAVPAQPGFCIERGFIPGGYAGGETATLAAEFPARDASLLVSTNSEAQNIGGSLLKRLTSLPVPLANLLSSDTEILRRGEKTVAGRTGDEYAYVVKDSKDVSFEWNAQTGDNHASEPSMKITMDTGSAVSLDGRSALIGLWEGLLTSVKLR
ncbi:T6SS immunity protein Tli4 family protein [Paraburkholderia sp. C35]|uniref:T6SS immunity protein Tli4 family protein n=1 Tax=Paraburkholderia sp. C35 TaxID=2126993 RepID=UPI000D687782|nr:T6SS immunity protein Tli4 family protein [Paraburkholderia sp. C35]